MSKKNKHFKKTSSVDNTSLEDTLQTTEENTSDETAGTAEVSDSSASWRLTEPKDSPETNDVTLDTGKAASGRRKLFLALGGILTIAIVVVAGIILQQKLHYQNKWYKNTTVDGIDLSGQTLEESKKNLENTYRNYALVIKGRDNGTLTVNGDDIDYSFQISSNFDQLFQKQHKTFSLFAGKNTYDLEFDVTYDARKLRRLLRQSDLVAGSDSYQITAPKAATVTYSDEKKQYVCVKEVKGNKIRVKALLTAVEDAIHDAKTTLDITNEKTYPDVYKAPLVSSDDDKLQTAVSVCNNAAVRYITWNMGEGVKEQITPSDISKWINYKDGKIKYDQDAISDWVEAFCLKYKTVGKNRKIKAHNGKTVTIVGGDYGWQIDFDKTLKQTKKALKAVISEDTTNAYIADPNAANKKALTLKRKVIYANTAFKKDYTNFINDWDTQNYIEISISAQKVYVIRNGKVKFSCHCITGRPVEGRRTPTGAFYIKEHREAYTLTGADYATPVKNWVRITWTGTGFHPATWQDWAHWTKDTYKTRGSHGCINLHPDDAKKIYNLSKYREPVFIY